MIPKNITPNVLILAGGYSRRMGQDKAMMILPSGKTVLDHVYQTAQEISDNIYLSIRPEQANNPLYEKYKPFIFDQEPWLGIGPLGGILSAFERDANQPWLILACDMPLLSTETLRLLTIHLNEDLNALAYCSAQSLMPEPLCALWFPRIKSKILEAIEYNIFCPRKVLMMANAKLLQLPKKEWLYNMNTPEHFQEIKCALEKFGKKEEL